MATRDDDVLRVVHDLVGLENAPTSARLVAERLGVKVMDDAAYLNLIGQLERLGAHGQTFFWRWSGQVGGVVAGPMSPTVC